MDNKKNNKKFSLFEVILLSIGGFAIGGLTTLVLNTVQIAKIRKNNIPLKYNCNIQAIIEPEKKITKNNVNESKGN